MLDFNNIYNCDCRDGLRQLGDNSVDLTVTSPPYDSLRTYQDDEFAWNFDIFKEVANELYRVTKPGGVVVWVVGDEVVNGGETGTSFRQALYFQELGFKIHDTMIYEKNSSTFPARITSKRYSQIFEYMFVFTKGKIRGDIKLIADKRNKWAGWTNWGTKTYYDKEGNLIQYKKNNKPTPEFSLRTNIWKYAVAFNDKTGHPAVFPEKLAEDHILSWTNEGDTVLDPFMGSGTTAKMAMLNKRNYIGFEKNPEYWEVSLKRVGKYVGKTNDSITEVAVNDSEGNSDTLQLNTVNDNEEAGKTEIFNNIVEQLNEYLNDMSLSILKTLKLTFATKANDERVKTVLKERGLYTGDTETVEEQPEKKEYEAPKVVSVTDVPKSDFISDLTLPNGGYHESQMEVEERGMNVSNDTFIKNVETILPDGVKFRGDEQKYFSVDDVDYIQAVIENMVEKLFRKKLTSDETISVLREKLSEPQPYTAQEQVETHFDKAQPIEDSGISVIDMQTMEPVQLNGSENNGNVLQPIDFEPSAVFESFQPKRKRGRPKGSKNKPKV